MKTLVGSLNLKGNPFEHYTAETEPDIANYAVRPPYLQAISARAAQTSSFILFGRRGAGKSATRITVYSEVWRRVSETDTTKAPPPFVVALTDFTSVMEAFKADKLTDRHLVAAVAFTVLEQMLAWLASLEESDRKLYLEGLNVEERTLTLALLRGFYLSVPEMDRAHSTKEALALLNSAWHTKSGIWIHQRWDALSKIIATAVSALSKHELPEMGDISAPAEALLKSLSGEAANVSRAILAKLVDFVRPFGYSGVCVLVDKVDETTATGNSAEATTRLILPVVTNIQLFEVSGFSWIFFLWSQVQDHFNSDKYRIRLDKLAHTDIEWKPDSLRQMIERRVGFFSSNELSFQNLFEAGVDVEQTFSQLCSVASTSPRELIKLLDTIVREHDVRGEEAPPRVDQQSIENGTDKYALETIGTSYDSKQLQQIYRLGLTTFVNKDVQSAFKIGDQSARSKIQKWMDTGLVRQSGTEASSEAGGKPAYRYVLADARAERIVGRKLFPVSIDEADTELE